METAGYVALTRQTGLWKEMQTVANNIANMATTGYRREGVVFAEMLKALPAEGGGVAMTDARARFSDNSQGGLSATGNSLDLAIQGEGYFMVETPDGPRLTRAGAFARNAESEVVNLDGFRLLDQGGAPIFVPPDAGQITVAADGTMAADGRPLAQIGLFRVENETAMLREGGTLFAPDTEPLPVDNPKIMQGFIEKSNVNPITEIARMIQVQRSYELGQKFMDNEHERIRNVTRTLGQRA